VTTADQLRFILLGVGLALIGGLWLWERRSGAQPPAGSRASARLPDRFEPQLDIDAEAPDALPSESLDVDVPPARSVDDERRPAVDPPVVTLDGLPEDLDRVEFARDRLEPAAEPPTVAVERPPTVAVEVSLTDTITSSAPLLGSAPASEPPVLTAVAVAARPQFKQAPPKPPPPEPPKHQRIVAIRLVAPPERRIDGGELHAALRAEGLSYGRYSIFHRVRADSRTLYSVASLVEPGSFDLTQIDSSLLPGFSMFAVFPGPMAAPQAFDEMLAAARRLAEKLNANLQDDSGSSLTGQRVLSLREELVHFEHLLAMTRTRPPP